MTRRTALWLVLALAVAGCKTRSHEEMEKVNAQIASEVQKTTGHEALVGYHQNGSHLEIMVGLAGASDKEVAAATGKVETIVKRHIPEVDKVTVNSVVP